MSIVIGLAIWLIPIIGVNFFESAHIFSFYGPLIAGPIYKTLAFLTGVIVDIFSRRVGIVNYVYTGYQNFKSFLKLKYINSQLKK